MRILILNIVFFLFSLNNCFAQEKLIVHYIGSQLKSTKNYSFLSKELKFLKENKDTLKMNIRLPYDTINHKIIDMGIFYNCHLREDTVYIIILKKICVNDITDVPNSYYKINTIPDKNDCSLFTEMEKNTIYKYEGNYGKYVDINNELFEIMGLSPSNDCFFSN
jgi:hypothetical protein